MLYNMTISHPTKKNCSPYIFFIISSMSRGGGSWPVFALYCCTSDWFLNFCFMFFHKLCSCGKALGIPLVELLNEEVIFCQAKSFCLHVFPSVALFSVIAMKFSNILSKSNFSALVKFSDRRCFPVLGGAVDGTLSSTGGFIATKLTSYKPAYKIWSMLKTIRRVFTVQNKIISFSEWPLIMPKLDLQGNLELQDNRQLYISLALKFGGIKLSELRNI